MFLFHISVSLSQFLPPSPLCKDKHVKIGVHERSSHRGGDRGHEEVQEHGRSPAEANAAAAAECPIF